MNFSPSVGSMQLQDYGQSHASIVEHAYSVLRRSTNTLQSVVRDDVVGPMVVVGLLTQWRDIGGQDIIFRFGY